MGMMILSDAPDSVLVERTLQGDEDAFAELVRRHQGLVSRTVYRIMGRSLEIEDAVQEVFLRVYSSLHRFDAKCHFEPWIARISTNYAIDQLRKRSRYDRIWVDVDEGQRERLLNGFSRNGDFKVDFSHSPEAYEEAARSLVLELAPKIRTAFILREVEHMDYEDVGRVLGISAIAARVRVSRARKELQKRFQDYLAKFQMRKHNRK